MTHIHRTVLQKKWKGRKHIAQLWYDYSTSEIDFPYLTKINMYPISDDGIIGGCISSVSTDGKGESKITLDDRYTCLMILIADGVIDSELGR